MNFIKKTTSWFSIILGIVALLIVVLHLGGINIYHHTDIPGLNVTKDRIITINKYQLTYPWITHHTDITLEDSIDNPEKYKDILKVLRSAQPEDTITFHLFGYGGRVDTALLLIHNIKKSKAKIHMSVESPVFSAHAYLAVSGRSLSMESYTYMMFHYSSVLNEDCDKKTGKDRGVSNKEHCKAFMKTDLYNNNKLVLQLPLLYPWEKFFIMTGHDVYITSDEFYKRVKNNV